MIVYGPPLEATLASIDKVSLFANTFRDIGRICVNELAGSDWQKDLNYWEEHKGNV